VGIEWPIPSGIQPNLSAKDLKGQSFAEIEKFP
jgi:dTDP-4-dehydrorhamnose 3,5-epimerase-like enzyme